VTYDYMRVANAATRANSESDAMPASAVLPEFAAGLGVAAAPPSHEHVAVPGGAIATAARQVVFVYPSTAASQPAVVLRQVYSVWLHAQSEAYTASAAALVVTVVLLARAVHVPKLVPQTSAFANDVQLPGNEAGELCAPGDIAAVGDVGVAACVAVGVDVGVGAAGVAATSVGGVAVASVTGGAGVPPADVAPVHAHVAPSDDSVDWQVDTDALSVAPLHPAVTERQVR